MRRRTVPGVVKDALIRTKQRITAWTQGCFARDAFGLPVASKSYAKSWCVSGALRAECEYDIDVYFEALELLARCMDAAPATFNDTHSHEEVLQMLDCAIEKAGEHAS